MMPKNTATMSGNAMNAIHLPWYANDGTTHSGAVSSMFRLNADMIWNI